ATAGNLLPQTEKSSKFVDDIVIEEGTPWSISVSVAATAANGIPTTFDGNTIVFTPNVHGAAPTATSVGAVDWACAADSNLTATARGLGSVGAGTLPAKYAPSECR